MWWGERVSVRTFFGLWRHKAEGSRSSELLSRLFLSLIKLRSKESLVISIIYI